MTTGPRSRPDWFYRQSAALPYRWTQDGLEVLLITSLKRRRWIVPKGIVEPGMTPAASAAREAVEEAGVEGDVADESLGSYFHPKWGGVCEVEVFPYFVSAELDEWEEGAIRSRRWVSIPEAMAMVEMEGLRDLVARMPHVAVLRDDTG